MLLNCMKLIFLTVFVIVYEHNVFTLYVGTHVSMYERTHVMYVRTYACVYAHTYVRKHTRMRASTHTTHVRIRTHGLYWEYVKKSMYFFMFQRYICITLYVRSCIHTHARTHVGTHVWAVFQAVFVVAQLFNLNVRAHTHIRASLGCIGELYEIVGHLKKLFLLLYRYIMHIQAICTFLCMYVHNYARNNVSLSEDCRSLVTLQCEKIGASNSRV